MDTSRGLAMLQAGCGALGIPPAAAKELLRLLQTKAYAGEAQAQQYGQSQLLDRLLHWLLLETEARDAVESLIGSKIWHSQATAADDEAAKAERRLASLDAMSRDGWTPRLELWSEASSPMGEIHQVELTDAGTGERFSVHYTASCGHDRVQRRLDDPQATASEAHRKRFADRLHGTRAGAVKKPDSQQPNGERRYVVKFCFEQEGTVVNFSIGRGASLGRAKKAAVKILGLPEESEGAFKMRLDEGIRVLEADTFEKHLAQVKDGALSIGVFRDQIAS